MTDGLAGARRARRRRRLRDVLRRRGRPRRRPCSSSTSASSSSPTATRATSTATRTRRRRSARRSSPARRGRLRPRRRHPPRCRAGRPRLRGGDPRPRRRARPGHGPPGVTGRRPRPADLAAAAGSWRIGLVVRIVGRLLRILLVVLVVVAGAVTGIVGAVTIRALPADRTARSRSRGWARAVTVIRDANGILQIDADTPARPVPRPGLRPRPGADVADGGLAPHLGRAACRSCSGRARSTRTGSSGRSAGGSAAERDLAALSPESAGRARRLRRRRERLDRRRTTARLSLPFVVTGLKSGIGGVGGYDLEPWTAARLARLAEGPGVAARRQLRQRDLPDARRREARRPGADRRAVPGVRRGRCR